MHTIPTVWCIFLSSVLKWRSIIGPSDDINAKTNLFRSFDIVATQTCLEAFFYSDPSVQATVHMNAHICRVVRWLFPFHISILGEQIWRQSTRCGMHIRIPIVVRAIKKNWQQIVRIKIHLKMFQLHDNNWTLLTLLIAVVLLWK